jgi:ABC-type glycerol-3-phosphate transport system substrate-binding protein
MNTRSLRLVALAATLTLTVAACGSGSDATGGDAKGEVTLWMYPVIKDPVKSKDFWAKVEKDFDAAHPEADLTIELQTFDKRDAQISAAIAAGSGPDIALVTPDMAATYRAVRGVLPVDDAVKDVKDEFLPQTLTSATFDGELYGVPLFINANTTAYNAKIFKEAGLELPKTWDDVLAAAPVLAKKGIAVMDYAGSPEQTLNLSFYPLLWQAGGTVFSKDGKDVTFDNAAGVSALQFLLDLNAAKGLQPDVATDASKVEGSPFAKGKVAMRPTTSLPELAQMRAALGEESVVLGAPLKGTVEATYGNPGLLALTSINSEDNRQAAYTAIQYLTSPEVQNELNGLAGNFPTRTDVKAQAANADVAAMNEALEFANPGEASPAARQVMAVLAPKIQAALRGDLSAEEALGKAADEAREVLKRTTR